MSLPYPGNGRGYGVQGGFLAAGATAGIGRVQIDSQTDKLWVTCQCYYHSLVLVRPPWQYDGYCADAFCPVAFDGMVLAYPVDADTHQG